VNYSHTPPSKPESGEFTVDQPGAPDTVKASSSTPGKIAKASKVQIEAKTKLTEAEAAMSQASAEVGPSKPADKKAAEKEAIEQSLPEKTPAPAPEALKENIEYIICHASGKKLSKEEE
jgi:hypothetical protein